MIYLFCFFLSLALFAKVFLLLLKHEGCTGEYWPEVGEVRSESSESLRSSLL